jgi:hypothetical protein
MTPPVITLADSIKEKSGERKMAESGTVENRIISAKPANARSPRREMT